MYKETYIDQFYNFFKKVNEKYSVVVPFDFNDYNDLSQYIVDSSKRLIDISLERTYTLKGKK
ncbi:Imm9 family immunity protein [Capnocytophaga gingivalis]|uniref:Imm9 family immunity protein n=1 Tax=Capnocytophaga gingivalis TaxID=1017 RepID=UPI0036F1BCA5